VIVGVFVFRVTRKVVGVFVHSFRAPHSLMLHLTRLFGTPYTTQSETITITLKFGWKQLVATSGYTFYIALDKINVILLLLQIAIQ
jgi:hypothetical protein